MTKRPHNTIEPGSRGGPRARTVAFIVLAGSAAAVASVSPTSLFIAGTDGLIALAILLAATGSGLWIVRGLRLHRAELRWQLIAATTLGLGCLALLVLGLGLLGILDRRVWVVLLAASGLSGVGRVRGLIRVGTHPADDSDAGRSRWLWLAVIGFVTLAVLASTVPPGILWPPEGNGYDVLEYHFAAPREYLEAGCIGYLPHNIYSNFPFNVEMLYLLTFVLRGDPVAAVFVAKLLNLALGVLFVAAVWLAGREYGPRSGIIAATVAASCPFLTYVSGIAYAENGMLLFTALALAALIRTSRAKDGTALRWTAMSGLAAGLACGCKYTAVPMVAIPLALAAVRVAKPRIRGCAVLSVCCLAGFAPWLVKNIVYTGNPVFPLAHSVFHERPGVWSEDGAARWHEGHLPDPNDRRVGGRLGRLWDEVLASPIFGPAILLSMVVGLLGVFSERLKSRGRHNASGYDRPEDHRADGGPLTCGLMLILGIGVWLTTTHLVGRFAIVLLVPAAVVLGRTLKACTTRPVRLGAMGALLIMVAIDLRTTLSLCRDAHVFEIASQADAAMSMIRAGEWSGQAHLPVLNQILESGRKVLMVGDARRFYLRPGVHYSVVFSNNPFADAAARRSPRQLVEWLREQGYDTVYVDWSEMHRLRASRYGFWESIDSALFEELTRVGLRRVRDFTFGARSTVYATLFAVRD